MHLTKVEIMQPIKETSKFGRFFLATNGLLLQKSKCDLF